MQRPVSLIPDPKRPFQGGGIRFWAKNHRWQKRPPFKSGSWFGRGPGGYSPISLNLFFRQGPFRLGNRGQRNFQAVRNSLARKRAPFGDTWCGKNFLGSSKFGFFENLLFGHTIGKVGWPFLWVLLTELKEFLRGPKGKSTRGPGPVPDKLGAFGLGPFRKIRGVILLRTHLRKPHSRKNQGGLRPLISRPRASGRLSDQVLPTVLPPLTTPERKG